MFKHIVADTNLPPAVTSTEVKNVLSHSKFSINVPK